MNILISILSHESSERCQKMLDHWLDLFKTSEHSTELLLLYGGEQNQFDKITFQNKKFISDIKTDTENIRFKTTDHQREKQSFYPCFKAIDDFITKTNKTDNTDKKIDYVLFVEYDYIPFKKNLLDVLINEVTEQNSEVIFHELKKINNTNHPHILYHYTDEKFIKLWQKMSNQSLENSYEKTSIYTALLPGSFWKPSVIKKIAITPEPFPIYFEIYLPTLLHYSKIKIGNIDNPKIFVSHKENRTKSNDKNLISCHPVKNFW